MVVLIKINVCGCMFVYILYNFVIILVNKNMCLFFWGDMKSEINLFFLYILCFFIVCEYKFLFFLLGLGFFCIGFGVFDDKSLVM